MRTFSINRVIAGNNNKIFLIAGPCQIESQDHAEQTAGRIKEICDELDIDLIYKSSFDKANRSSVNTQRGIGIDEGLKMLGAFLWDKIISFPRNLLEAIIETFNRKATKLFFGEDGDIAIDVHKDLRRYGMQVKDGQDLLKIQKVKDSVKSVVDDILLGPTYRGQHPQLWQQQRELILAVLDGNSPHFPNKILADTEKLIPKHGNVWSVPEFLLDMDEDPDEIISSLDWLDVDEAQKISTRLEEEISLLQSELRVSRQEMLDAEKEKLGAKAAARKLRNEREREASKEKSLSTIIKEFGDVTS
jgi:hypothetical protein